MGGDMPEYLTLGAVIIFIGVLAVGLIALMLLWWVERKLYFKMGVKVNALTFFVAAVVLVAVTLWVVME